ncbi:MAG: hypothetical protein PVG26_14980, partial [Desulfobacterales bacterium]
MIREKLRQTGAIYGGLVGPLRWLGFNSEPQNIEYRTAELRRMVSLRSIFYKFFFKQIEFIPST